jgi:hypothetical protein
VVNLHKYMILHGLKFSKSDHVFFIHVLYGLLTTKHVDTVTLDTFAKVSPAFGRCGKLVLTAAKDLKPLLHRGRPSYRRSLKLSKKGTSSTSKHEFFYFFLLLWVIFALLDPDPDSEYGSGSGSTDQIDPDPKPRYRLRELM